jgi:hypothetical protein
MGNYFTKGKNKEEEEKKEPDIERGLVRRFTIKGANSENS